MEDENTRRIKEELCTRQHPFTLEELVPQTADLHTKYTYYGGIYTMLMDLICEGEMASFRLGGKEYYVSKSWLINQKREEHLKKFFGD